MPNKQIKQWISWGLLFSALAYSLLWVVCGGGNIKDPFYWMAKYSALESSWMTCGTIAVGYLWMLLFGKTIFSLRVLGWLCTTVAVALPYVMLLDKEQRRANLHWLGLTYWLVGYGSFQEFSPGTLSVLQLSALMCMLVSEKHSSVNGNHSMVIGLIIATLVLIRFPNILAVGVLAVWYVWRFREEGLKTNFLKQAAIGIGTAAVVYAMGIVCWYYCMNHGTTAPVAQHTIEKMVQMMGENGYRLVADVALWGAFGFGLWLAGRAQKAVWQWLIAVATGGLMLYYVIYAFPASQWYNIDQSYLIVSLVLFLAVVLIYQRGKHDLPMSELWLSLLMMSVASLGTDTGWLKLFPALLCLLPWWASYVQWPCRQRYVLTAMLIITTLFVVRFSTNAIGRHNIFKENTWGQTSIMHLTRISDEENARMLQMEKDYAIYSRQGKVYGVGDALHMFRAMTRCEQPVRNEFWSNIFDPVYTKWYSELVGKEHPIIFCFYSPTFRTKQEYKDKESKVEVMLRDSGYTVVDRSEYQYMIYVKN